MMTGTAADHSSYLVGDDSAIPQVEELRQCLLRIFQDCDDITAIRVSGLLIEYSRDMVLPALGAIRRQATASARAAGMSVPEIMSATNLSYAVVSRLITENRGTTAK